jgi:hypothetical protein
MCYNKLTLFFVWSTRYACQTLMKFEFTRQIFEKYSTTKFHENPLIVYYQQMQLMLILFNLKCLKQ